MICPFQPGDRIHELRAIATFTAHRLPDIAAISPTMEMDETKPDATVIALTEKGFTYRYDRPVPIGRAAWGSYVEEGECYELGFLYWRKVATLPLSTLSP